MSWTPESERNLQWSIEMQKRHAVPLYKEYWEGSTVIEVDSLNVVGDTADATELTEQLDFSGLDKIIIDDEGTPFVIAQRIRPDVREHISNGEEYGADFSFRIETRGDSLAEIGKFHKAREKNFSMMPEIYAFGVADVYKDENPNNYRQIALNRGFRFFGLYDLQSLLDDYFERKYPENRHWNGDGTKGTYISLSDIEEHLIHSWEKDTSESELWNDDQQSGLAQFGGDV